LLDLRCSGSDAPAVTRYRTSPHRKRADRDTRLPPARAGSFIDPKRSSNHTDKTAAPVVTRGFPW
jgi:hypothetical protein